MLNPRVASRYAKSLIDLAVEKGQLERVYKDMLFLQQLTKESREFLNLLKSPVVKSDLKIKAVNGVTAGRISDMTISFTTLLMNKHREIVLPEVITFLSNSIKRRNRFMLSNSQRLLPVSESLKKSIIAQVKKTSKMENIELEEVVDPSIIGGFVLQAGDQLIDASISYDLKTISRQFENNDFIYKVR